MCHLPLEHAVITRVGTTRRYRIYIQGEAVSESTTPPVNREAFLAFDLRLWVCVVETTSPETFLVLR